jgi:beta-lactamase regulating signal transducer with metallopeptidase domain
LHVFSDPFAVAVSTFAQIGALSMWMWLGRTGLILFDAALSTALFLSVVVCALLFCRQPSRRLLIVRSSLLGALAILPVVAMLPLPRVDVLDLILRADLLPPSFRAVHSGATDGVRGPEPALADRLHSSITIFKGDYAAWAGRWLPRSLTLIVLAVAGTGAAWVLLGFWGVHWLLRHSREPSPSTQAIYDGLSAGRRTKKQVRPDVRVSSSVQRPVLVGLRRTTILIPASYEEPDSSAELLRLSLLHELAHADQSDPWFGTIASLAQSVWFYLPHIWWLRSQLIIDQEFMADHAASLRYGTPEGYAASLLALAVSRPAAAEPDRPLGPRSIVPSTQKRGARSPLFQRMLMLLHCPFPVEQDLPRRWSWSLRFVVIVASLASACLCIRWPHARALEEARGGDALSSHEPFRVAGFVASPLVFTPGGRALPYHMPVALASHFDLRVEVLSSMKDLEKIHIAGHPLVGDPTSKRVDDRLSNPSSYAESWHLVRLRRGSHELALWIDGRKASAAPNAAATSEWLTFEPGPERPTTFRNLVVEW